MTDTNPEIGSGIPPRAAEVEPPAAVVHAGGSADRPDLIGIHEAARDLLQARERLGYAVHDRRDLWEILSLAAASDVANDAGMGVTSNAILLLGYLARAVDRLGADARYRFIAGGAGGLAVVEHVANGNTYRVSVVQLQGTE